MKQVCHRDLKLENTLLDGSPAPRLKICDFGYSKVPGHVSFYCSFARIHKIFSAYKILYLLLLSILRASISNACVHD